MMLFRIILGTLLLLWAIYCVLVIGHILNIWEITKEEITIGKLLIPFYYLKHLKS